MNKWQILYVKIDNFWDNIPAPIKVPIYQAISAGLLLLADYFMGKVITKEMWQAVLSAFVANEAAVIIEFIRKNGTGLDELKVEYNKSQLGR